MYTSVHVCRASAAQTKTPPKKHEGKKNAPKKSGEKKETEKFCPWKSILRFSSPLIPPPAGGFSKIPSAVILRADGRTEASPPRWPMKSRRRDFLVDDLVDGGLLVARPRHDVLVVRRDVAAQDGRRLLGLLETKQ